MLGVLLRRASNVNIKLTKSNFLGGGENRSPWASALLEKFMRRKVKYDVAVELGSVA